MNPIDFGDQGSKVKVSMDIYGKKASEHDRDYCEIIYFRGAKFLWIHENGYIRGDVISWVGWLGLILKKMQSSRKLSLKITWSSIKNIGKLNALKRLAWC